MTAVAVDRPNWATFTDIAEALISATELGLVWWSDSSLDLGDCQFFDFRIVASAVVIQSPSGRLRHVPFDLSDQARLDRAIWRGNYSEDLVNSTTAIEFREWLEQAIRDPLYL